MYQQTSMVGSSYVESHLEESSWNPGVNKLPIWGENQTMLKSVVVDFGISPKKWCMVWVGLTILTPVKMPEKTAGTPGIFDNG